ncbi:MAG: acyl carrier protein [Myxococcota bacterium]|nr:acyl carrier protein [Myxococcota bacterium]
MSAPALDDITRFIFETLRDELLSVDTEFTPEGDLIDAGLDSLTATQLLLAIEERTGVWVDESVLTPENLASCEALARSVCQHIEAG